MNGITKITKTSELKCILTPEERATLNAAIPALIGEVESLRDTGKTLAASYKSRADDKETELRRLARKMREGYEYRQVSLTERRDYDRRVVEFVRDDTGEVAECRPMTSDDLQLELQQQAAADADSERATAQVELGLGLTPPESTPAEVAEADPVTGVPAADQQRLDALRAVDDDDIATAEAGDEIEDPRTPRRSPKKHLGVARG